MLVVAVTLSLLAGTAVPVAGAGGNVSFVDLVATEDRDGDGWVSSFTVEVTSNVCGATVLVDGRAVGTTPYVGNYWTEEPVDVEIRADGYIHQSYTDVSPEAAVHADLVPPVSVGTPTFDPGILRNLTATAAPTTTGRSGHTRGGSATVPTPPVDRSRTPTTRAAPTT